MYTADAARTAVSCPAEPPILLGCNSFSAEVELCSEFDANDHDSSLVVPKVHAKGLKLMPHYSMLTRVSLDSKCDRSCQRHFS